MFLVVDNPFSPALSHDVRESILSVKPEGWDRYDNPFEQKWVMKKPYLSPTASAVDVMRSLIGIAQLHTGKELVVDRKDEYQAVFKYEPMDYLSIHRDADRSPTTKRKKEVTVLLYLSTDDELGSPLTLLKGDTESPGDVVATIQPHFNTLVMFDTSEYNVWHGNPDPVVQGIRIVLTCSFMGKPTEDGRQRAYFAPTFNDAWNKETFELRDLRADPDKYNQAYKV